MTVARVDGVDVELAGIERLPAVTHRLRVGLCSICVHQWWAVLCHTALMARRSVSDGGPYEDMYGYCRGVRVGNQIHIAGTTADPAVAAGGAGMYEQTASALRRIVNALQELGAMPSDVVRTVAYTTDVTRFEETARAHREVFGEVRPAGTLVEVGTFVSPDYLIEIEAYAVLDD